MIKLKNVTTNTEHVVKPTIFPDGTSQVWQLPKEVFQNDCDYTITWFFENEGELIQLYQLKMLLNTLQSERQFAGNRIDLIVPYFPYARQDKQVDNETTFAGHSFRELLYHMIWSSITTFDIHSSQYDIKSKKVDNFIQKSIEDCKADLVCFPDKGATTRGYKFDIPSFNLDKTRNQLTGKIEGMECKLPLDLKGKNILIVDDLCDGGRTFIEAAKLLYSMGAETVNLYVTHGIFSNGVYTVLHNGNIKKIYTTNSYIKSQEMLARQTEENVVIFKLEE